MATRTAEAPLALKTVSSAVDGYFAGFNAEDYRAVAALFEADGVLLAPFEEPIVGPEAVYTYLQAEAVSMRAKPVEVESDDMASDGIRRVVVKGRVKTLLFTVSVRWTFALTAADTIQSAEIKLVASLQELMQLDRG
ncbi:MAG: nuclear transport factor 2 family protein [Tildeniella torsiva UHER 1998/13D]|nr:nuclear transport factor 2 family protein [Tildeniella torsiva UHER 1998/13D]